MKISDYKNIFSKIDTDPMMDCRIKNKLLNYDYENYDGIRNMNKSYVRVYIGGKKRIMSKLVPAGISVAFLALLVILLMGSSGKVKKDEIAPASENRSPMGQIEEMKDTDSEKIGEVNLVVNKLENSDDMQLTIDEIPDELKEFIGNSTTEVDIAFNSSGESENTSPIVEPNESNGEHTAKDKGEKGEFYLAYFDVNSTREYKYAISGLIIRLKGFVDTINPEDLTDLILTRDGIPVINEISKEYTVNQFVWSYEEVTDFYFSFETINCEPGVYGLTGKYKGKEFSVYNKVIEEKLDDLPADPMALIDAHWVYYPDKDGKPQEVSEVMICFSGTQSKFNLDDVTDLQLTIDGVIIEDYAFMSDVFRYLEVVGESVETKFALVFKEPFTESGTYVISGKYMGVPFTSAEIKIP